MKGNPATAPAVLLFLAGSAVLLAQDVPLPEVGRQPSPATTVSERCSDPIVPDAREPLAAPIVVAEQQTPARDEIERREAQQRSEAPAIEVQLPPAIPTELSAHQAMALLQSSARGGTYDDFVRALAITRAKVVDMPTGSDKRAFNEALDVHADIEEIWKYAMTDPMGAFYNNDRLSGMFSRLAQKYPRYATFIGPYSVTDSAGNQFYPTTETRQFLIEEAEKRLRGVKLPAAPEVPGVIAERAARPAPEIRREPERRVAEGRPEVRRPAEERRPVAVQPRRAARPPARRRAAPSRREAVPPAAPAERAEPTAPAVEPTETAAAPTATGAQIVAEPPSVVTIAEATTAPPERPIPARPTVAPAQREIDELLREERKPRGPSATVMLLGAFGLIALLAIALLLRAFRSREPAETSIIRPEPTEPAGEEPKATEEEWIDSETRHWIDENKSEKPPN